jgi:hypothetical protein
MLLGLSSRNVVSMNLKTAIIRFRITLLLFIVGLLVSGITAFPLLSELRFLCDMMGLGNAVNPENHSGLAFWILTVRNGLEQTYNQYPWIAYGTDWLAFAHIIIAGFFIGPLLNPTQSRATIYAGIFACLGIIPLAFICGSIREIPFYWRLIDCGFGIIGVFPLLYCLYLQGQIFRLDNKERP